MKVVNAVAVMAFLGAFAAAGQAAEAVNASSNFLSAASPLGVETLVESRSGVGVVSNDEGPRRRLRSEDQARDRADLRGTAAPFSRAGGPRLPSGRPASLATDVKVPPSVVSAVRGELQRLGVLK